MKRILFGGTVAAYAALVGLLTACDWSGGGGEDFNASRGAVNINISGYFKGLISGRAVANTSGGPISSFTIQQSGNVVQVTDSNGSTYRGTVGSPSAVASAGSDGTIPAGATVATFQISWSGKDATAARDIEFTGVITLVTTDNIRGDNTTRTITSDVDTSTGSSSTVGSTTNSTSTVVNDNSVREIITDFQITENTSQMRLQGTWIEAGGVSSRVDALGSGAAGGISIQTGGGDEG